MATPKFSVRNPYSVTVAVVLPDGQRHQRCYLVHAHRMMEIVCEGASVPDAEIVLNDSHRRKMHQPEPQLPPLQACLLYTSDAADEGNGSRAAYARAW